MGESFGHGIRRIVGEVVSGIVNSSITDAIIGTGLVSPAFVVLFSVLNMLYTVVLVLAMPYWGTIYLFGWLFGLVMLSQTGMIGILDATVYFGVPLIVLIIRFGRKLKE